MEEPIERAGKQARPPEQGPAAGGLPARLAGMHSAYRDLDASAAARHYLKRMHRMKAAALLGEVLCLAALVWGGLLGGAGRYWLVLELACLGAALAISLSFRRRLGQLYAGLPGMALLDGQPGKYRAVAQALALRDRLGRSRGVLQAEIATALYYEGRPADALALLGQVRLRRGHTYWVRVYNVAALCCSDLGDEPGRRQAMENLQALTAAARPGSSRRAALERLTAQLQLRFAAGRWTPAQEALALAWREEAPTPQAWAGWTLELACRAAGCGRAADARAYLAQLDAAALPLMPCYLHRAAGLRRALVQSGG